MEQWSTSDIHYINKYQLLTAKPVFYVVNLTKKDFARKKNKWLSKIHEWIQSHGGGVMIPFSGEFECDLQNTPEVRSDAYRTGARPVIHRMVSDA